MAKLDMNKRKDILDDVRNNYNELSKRIIVIDGFENLGKTSAIENVRLFLETLGYDVVVKKEKITTNPQFFKKDKESMIDEFLITRLNELSISLMELSKNKNLFIIYDELYFSTILQQFNLNMLEYKQVIDKIDMEFKNFNCSNIEHIVLLPNNIYDYENGFLNDDTIELIENIKNKILNDKKDNIFGNSYNFILVEKYMSKKGIFIKILEVLYKKMKFDERFIDVKITKLSSFYSFESHGEILSICRGLNKILEKENTLSTIRRKHYSTLQFFHYTFYIKDIPRTVLIELSRYRTINAMCVESTRYVLNKLKNSEDKIYKFINPIVRKLSVDVLDKIIKLVRKKEINNDEIKMSLPESFTTSLYMKIDLRNLSHLLAERIDKGVHKEFRRLVYSMLYEICLKNPEYFEILCLMI